MKTATCYCNDDFIVTEFGDIIRIKGKGKLNTPLYKEIKNGYERFTLSINNKKTHKPIHQLVQISFNGEYDKSIYEIDHIDDNRSNNNLTNLQLLTKPDNQRKSKKKRCVYERNDCYVVDIKNYKKRYYKSFSKNKYIDAYNRALEQKKNKEKELGLKEDY